jgi:CBS domain-containing protein
MAMPSSDPPPPTNTAAAPAGEPRNLPIAVPRPSAVAREGGDTWLARALRALFGWRLGSIRSDLWTVLEGGAGETGFSPKESAMLQNILSLRERRVADVMVPRADIIAVQKDIALGDLLKVFASQAHSRLVVYDDTLDDAIGMVHIRDLIALMTTRAEAAAQAGGKNKRCRQRAFISRSWSMNMAAPTASSPWRTSSSRSSARSATSMTRIWRRAWCAKPTAPTSPTRAPASRT